MLREQEIYPYLKQFIYFNDKEKNSLYHTL